ncbi:MAG: amidase family protein, partial [Comamonas sp.]
IGKTNMTEFAFSGIGINPHYGTPGNAKDVARIPGGSSSGAGVAVARGMCDIAIGSDTGGSIRIPSALNGVTGFKPSQSRVSREGAFPLSFTLDTVGPLARSVEDCAKADAVLASEQFKPLAQRSVEGLRIAIPRGLLFTQVDDAVNQAFNAAVEKLKSLGAKVQVIDIEHLINAPFKLQENGTMIASEAAAIHAEIFAQGKDDQLDALVKSRITRGQEISASHYVSVKQAREKLLPEFDAATADFDVLVMPTVAVVAPTIASLEVAEEFHRVNGLVLRNTSVFNFYDLPTCSLPISVADGQLPVGLMVVGQRQRDRDLLAVAQAISPAI